MRARHNVQDHATRRTQQILVSVLRTCWQQGKDAFTRCVRLLRAPRAVILDIVPGADGPRHSAIACPNP